MLSADRFVEGFPRIVPAPEQEIVTRLESAILLVAPDGEILFNNRSCRAALGGDLTGRRLTGLGRQDEGSLLARVAASYLEARESGGRYQDLLIWERDAQVRYYWLGVSPGLDGRMVLSLEEITSALRRAPALTQVLAQLIHDLRTPLTSIAGAVELILSGRLGPLATGQRRMVDIVDESARKMKSMLAKNETGLDACGPLGQGKTAS
ncbi:MAG: histidine kinase dimerization/phospho-acceptor domain-containing protein [Acidobacteriota bacterium]